MSSVQRSIARARQCPYCGRPVAMNHLHCPHCREVVPRVRLAPTAPAAVKGGRIRRGFLYMVLGLVIHYVAARSDSLNLPFSVNPTVSYLSTMLFLGGLALALYGLITKATA